jgi:DNA-binding GntR family transcriptional regulator
MANQLDQLENDGEGLRSRLAELAPSFRGGYQTVEAMAQAFMREAIIRGIFPPGEKLNQDEIAATLGVSRIPVRACLRQLEAEGLVTIEPHRGARVSVLKASEVAELYAIRILLEDRLLDLACRKITPEGLESMRQAARAVDDGIAAGASSWRSSEDIDRRRSFYSQLYSFADQPRTLRLVEQLRDEVGRYLLMHRIHSHELSHVAFVELVAAGDRRAARRWLRDHLTQVSEEIQRLLTVRATQSPAAGEPSAVPKSSPEKKPSLEKA